jgi:cytochrome c biogenesis protein CcmG, thiol:disulfide interchange protein DsbE
MSRPRISIQKVIGGLILVAAVVALAVFGLAGSDGRAGRPAPALPSDRLAGNAVTLAQLRGRPALVTFWASWCGPCIREAPALERFSRGLGSRATLVGVDWSDSLAGARSFIKRYAWSFPNLRDPEGSAGLDYGLTGLPTTFVIDSNGRLRGALRGPQTQQTLTRALASVRG